MPPTDPPVSPLRIADLARLHVAVWGYGREGRAALSTLRQRFPDKALTVFCSESEEKVVVAHSHSQDCAGSAAVRVVTAAPDAAALRNFDVIVKSPGISPYKAPVPEALAAGVRFTSGTALWFADHPHARTICVTGTKGKSTVAALIAHLLRKGGMRIALAGNIGLPLLDVSEREGRAPDWWVIELSSFQIQDFGGAPSVAVINNLYEEHLDWHGTPERYRSDKLAIGARAQRLVVNAQQDLLAVTAGHNARTVFGCESGWHVAGSAILHAGKRVFDLARSPLPGEHNAHNICAALAAIDVAGLDATVLAAHIASFAPLPHRLQTLGERDDIVYVNDSISTTPYATIEALRSMGERSTTVLVGGFDRGVSWSTFVDYVVRQPPHAIVTMGANGARIAQSLATIEPSRLRLVSAASLDQALALAREHTPRAGTILMSPGAPSFDQFHDYAERGREFARLAGFDPVAIGTIAGLGVA